jgi:hypothetical protein
MKLYSIKEIRFQGTLKAMNYTHRKVENYQASKKNNTDPKYYPDLFSIEFLLTED